MTTAPDTRLDVVYDRLEELSRDVHSAICANAISKRRVSKAEVDEVIQRLIGARMLLVHDDGSDECAPRPQWAASTKALDAARRAGFDWD